MKKKDFFLKFSWITTLLISPFVILVLITPITNIPVYINLWCIGIGTLIALVIANRLRNDFLVIRYKNKLVFLTEISTYLHKIGYEQLQAEEAKITYRGTLQTSLLSGDIEVIMQTGKALIIAPKIYLKKLMKLMPLTNMYLVDESFFQCSVLYTNYNAHWLSSAKLRKSKEDLKQFTNLEIRNRENRIRK